jgi:hypothetical protein
VTGEGLIARVAVDPPTGFTSVALYRHPEDIALPAPIKASVADLAWLDGAWVGTRGTGGTTSIEERWSPPLGGALLGVSRTVSRGRMTAFEFLRIVELDTGVVYIAQPNGRPPTEFVLISLDGTRAVFVNPRHSSPQRIEYELSADGGLSATIGFARGGRLQRFEFRREGSQERRTSSHGYGQEQHSLIRDGLDSKAPRGRRRAARGRFPAFLKRSGWASLDDSIPFPADTPVNEASISRTSTAWGVMRLVADGAIRLDEPVNRYLKRWLVAPNDQRASEVTVRRVLKRDVPG